MRKYIIFKADPDAPGWENRKLQHTQGLTDILTEHWDSSNKPMPEPGYRFRDFVRVEEKHDANHHAYSTHHRLSDWEVVRVETYSADIAMSEFDAIAICYCRYNPIETQLLPMPERQVSPASFGNDEKDYAQWQSTAKS